jgi:hypothetical protein
MYSTLLHVLRFVVIIVYVAAVGMWIYSIAQTVRTRYSSHRHGRTLVVSGILLFMAGWLPRSSVLDHSSSSMRDIAWTYHRRKHAAKAVPRYRSLSHVHCPCDFHAFAYGLDWELKKSGAYFLFNASRARRFWDTFGLHVVTYSAVTLLTLLGFVGARRSLHPPDETDPPVIAKDGDPGESRLRLARRGLPPLRLAIASAILVINCVLVFHPSVCNAHILRREHEHPALAPIVAGAHMVTAPLYPALRAERCVADRAFAGDNHRRSALFALRARFGALSGTILMLLGLLLNLELARRWAWATGLFWGVLAAPAFLIYRLFTVGLDHLPTTGGLAVLVALPALLLYAAVRSPRTTPSGAGSSHRPIVAR